MKKRRLATIVIWGGVIISLIYFISQIGMPDKYGAIEYKLFQVDDNVRPLIAVFGGSEGGLAFADEKGKDFRDSVLAAGYHFASFAYFNTANTPELIDRISLDAIYDTLKSIGQQSFVDSTRIVLLGTSRGGELVLNLAANFHGFDAVVAVVPSSVTVPARIGRNATSSWTLEQKQLPFLSFSTEAENLVKEEGFYDGMSLALKGSNAESEIKVENIKSANPPDFFYRR